MLSLSMNECYIGQVFVADQINLASPASNGYRASTLATKNKALQGANELVWIAVLLQAIVLAFVVPYMVMLYY